MKVKATNDFNYYRLKVLAAKGLSVEEFEALQQGKVVEVDDDFYEENKHILEKEKPHKKKEVK